MDKYRNALLAIGSEHPAVVIKREPNIVETLFNRVISEAHDALDAQGNDADEKADWCERELNGKDEDKSYCEVCDKEAEYDTDIILCSACDSLYSSLKS